MTNDDCVFCKIVARVEPAVVLDTWPETIAIRPLNPVVSGHVLIIPECHVNDFTEDPLITAMTFARASEYAYTHHQYYPDVGINLITSAGELATQSVFHLHVHVIPRKIGDGIKLPWSDQ